MCHCAAKLVGTFHFLAHEAYVMVHAKYATITIAGTHAQG